MIPVSVLTVTAGPAGKAVLLALTVAAPVRLSAAELAQITELPRGQVLQAVQALAGRQLVRLTGDGRYALPALACPDAGRPGQGPPPPTPVGVPSGVLCVPLGRGARQDPS